MSWVNLFVVTGSGAEGIYSAHADGRPVAIMSGDGQALVGIVNGVASVAGNRIPGLAQAVALATNPMAATWTVAKIGMDIRDFRKLSLSDAISIVGNGFAMAAAVISVSAGGAAAAIPLLAIGAGLTIAGTPASLTGHTFPRGPGPGRSPQDPTDPLTHPTPTTPPPAWAVQKAVSPLILDLDGDGVETLSYTSGIFFDHDGDGFAEETGWVGRTTACWSGTETATARSTTAASFSATTPTCPEAAARPTGLRRWRCSTATATAKSTPTTNASMNCGSGGTVTAAPAWTRAN